MKKKTITFSEFKRLCVCNSEELRKNTYSYGGKNHRWVGIGMVEEGPARFSLLLSPMLRCDRCLEDRYHSMQVVYGEVTACASQRRRNYD